MKLRVLDLFSGIGGFSLGLERATLEGADYDGFETVAFCEIEEFPRKVLAKHWPEVPCYRDVRELTAARLAADGIAADVICGGFPCQDISFAGKGAGLAGERSGLFYEIARLVGELGPRFIILENVGALLSRGLDAVLGTLASLGYDAEWHCIPASYVGAPHRRDRCWIVAYASHNGHGADHRSGKDSRAAREGEGIQEERQWFRPFIGRGSEALADPHNPRLEGRLCPTDTPWGFATGHTWKGGWWDIEPNVGRVAHGVPSRVDRIKALGNAVVPQIPELIGRALLQAINKASGNDTDALTAASAAHCGGAANPPFPPLRPRPRSFFHSSFHDGDNTHDQ